MSDSEVGRTGGRRLVVGLYAVVVALTGLLGFVIGYIAPQGLDPELFGLIQLAPTPFGMAVYGAATVGTILGVLLLAVAYVSARYADEGTAE